MFTKLGWKTILIGCVVALSILSVKGQSDSASARRHYELARSYSSADDPRTEQEYRQAIADSNGIYPEAWEWLSRHLSFKLRFHEAASAWRTYVNQIRPRVSSMEVERLHSLDRAAQLTTKSDNGEALSAEEMIELIKLVNGFGAPGDAVPYAQKAVRLFPDSAMVLVALAELIKNEQKDRALELLSQAIALKPNDPTIYVSRGSCYFWAHGDPVKAESDFRRAIDLSKGLNASAWAVLGDLLAQSGRRNEAIAAYRKYLTIRPRSSAHYDGEIRKSIKRLQDTSPHP